MSIPAFIAFFGIPLLTLAAWLVHLARPHRGAAA